MDDLIAEFLVETNDNLQALDNDFVKLEQNPADKDIINNIFRSMHTIKGTCGFLGLERLAKLAHAAENVMDRLREGTFPATPAVISLILKANDQIKAIIEYLEANEAEPEGADAELIASLNECASNGGKVAGASEAPPPAAPKAAASPATTPVNKTPDLDEAVDFEPVKADYAGGAPATPAAPVNKTPDLDEAIDFEPVKADYAAHAPASAPPPAKSAVSPKAKEEAVAKGLKTAAEEDPDKKGTSGQSIRVGLDVLENLMQMVGELVLTRNQLLQLMRSAGQDAHEFTGPLQRLNLITTELQEGVMQTRMQPIGNAWAKFPRLIRDLALELNKKIDLKMIGADTELDRQMLEAIKDPLTHMVRNSADHGIDTPAERHAAGKSETGTVTLSAYHEGGHIIIKIADDGRGLNVDRIKKKAVENGLASQADIDNMSDKQIYQFIFKAGFSTAEKVTAVSGRGVGMDVVVSNIQKIGGTIELNSKQGRGSEFIIKLPLTLAIMSVLIIRSGTETFAIPQIRVSEIVRTEQPVMDESDRNGSYKVELIHGAPVLRIREHLLPLISVSGTLKIPRQQPADNDNAAPAAGLKSVEPFVVVCEVGSQQVGLLVDEVFHTEEIVVKPLAKIIKSLEVYSGCTILGDGSVIMILDPNGIIKACGESAMVEDAGTSQENEDEGGSGADRIVNFLTFTAWSKSPKAVPLDLVARLEEVDMKNIEWSGHQPVVQYRGGLMRLVTLDAATPLPQEGMLNVIVFSDGDKIMGLVVESILDIVKQAMDVVSPTTEQGLLGSVVIGDSSMDLVDISHCFGRAFGGWLGHSEAKALAAPEAGGAKRPHLLLVDDSPFFRKFMKPVLTVAGYDVTDASSAAEGLELLRNTKYSFDLVVTDIDMPEMNGLEFVEAAKKDPRLAMLPYIALSSHTEADIGDIKQRGLNAFVTKSDRDRLVNVIQDVLSGGGKVAA